MPTLEVKTLERKRSRKIRVKTTPRGAFASVPGKVWCSIDYSSQEIRTAAALSKDPVMENALLADPILILPDGREVANPDSDIHTLTAVTVCYPDRLLHLPRVEWVGAARKLIVNNKNDDARQMGKKFNFTAIYLAAPQTFSDLLYVPLDTAKSWCSNFQVTYAGYYSWAMQVGGVDEVRGWSTTYWIPRTRWVNESNAKGAGESPLRSAVNHKVQGECANQLKVSLIRIDNMTFGTEVEILMPVHDETNFLVPGEAYLDEEKSKWDGDLLLVPHYEFSDEALEWSQRLGKVMEDVQTECFQSMNSPLKGGVDINLAPYWKH